MAILTGHDEQANSRLEPTHQTTLAMMLPRCAAQAEPLCSRIHEPGRMAIEKRSQGEEAEGGGTEESEVGVVRWTQESLLKARGVVMVAVGVLILIAYLIWRLRAS